MFNLGMGEIIVIFIVALFVFGPGKLPEVSRALGKSLREFRKAMNTVVEAAEEPEEKTQEKGDTNGKGSKG